MEHYINLPTSTYLGRSLKSGVHSDLWHVPVVDVLVAVPHAVDQVSLKKREDQTLTVDTFTSNAPANPNLGNADKKLGVCSFISFFIDVVSLIMQRDVNRIDSH